MNNEKKGTKLTAGALAVILGLGQPLAAAPAYAMDANAGQSASATNDILRTQIIVEADNKSQSPKVGDTVQYHVYTSFPGLRINPGLHIGLGEIDRSELKGKDLEKVEWSTSDASIMTIDKNGLATCVGEGDVDITATYDGKSDTLKGVHVSAADNQDQQEQHTIYVMPEEAHDGKAPQDSTVRFYACIDAPEEARTYEDNLAYAATEEQMADIEWTSSNPDVLTVDENGVATCVGIGQADVTATYKGAKDVYKHFVVKRHVYSFATADEHKKSAKVGETVQFAMFVDLPEGADTLEERLEHKVSDEQMGDVTWETSDDDIMTIDENGLATCTGKGLADITATYNGMTYKIRNFEVEPADVDEQQGQDQQDNQDQQGQDQQDNQDQEPQEQHTIYLVPEEEHDGSATLGNTVRFFACIDAPEECRTTEDYLAYAATEEQMADIEWESSDRSVLRIDENGVATCTGIGHADVTATYKGAKDVYKSFVVKQHVLSISAEDAHLESARIGDRVQFGAYLDVPEDVTNNEGRADHALSEKQMKEVKWESSNPEVITFDENGRATCVGTGTVSVTATYKNLKSNAYFFAVTDTPFFLDADPNDTANHGKAVEWMGRKGISAGWEAGSGRVFRGMEDVKRCDLAAFLYRMADMADDDQLNESIMLSDEKVAEVLSGVSDVNPSTPHAAEIAWMIDSGISRGWANANGTIAFRPYATVARQDMAAFLYRYDDMNDNGKLDDSCATQTKRDIEFSDMARDDEGNHAKEVYWLGSTGISEGWEMEDGTREFRGTESVKRQDMAAFLYRM